MQSVIDERSLIASMPPKICSALPVWRSTTMRVHSSRRGPSTGWSRYARASASDAMAYVRDVSLNPSPAICGNTNHIQWLVLRPRRSSSTACA